MRFKTKLKEHLDALEHKLRTELFHFLEDILSNIDPKEYNSYLYHYNLSNVEKLSNQLRGKISSQVDRDIGEKIRREAQIIVNNMTEQHNTYLNSEAFIDAVVKRINEKQLK